MPLLETKGAASAQGFGLTLGTTGANFIEDVFSTYLYLGTGATQTITNGIDLAGEGGLVWIKYRSGGLVNASHALTDTARGVNNYLSSNGTAGATTTWTDTLTAFNSNGYTLGADATTSLFNYYSATTNNYVSWTFRKQPKFFDVVTYTGTGANRTIAHNLGSTPGCIIVKRTDTTGNWQVYHNGLTSAAYSIQLNLTNAQASATTVWNSTAPTSTVFSVGTDATVNASGGTYVAYLFAHNAGGFGLTGTDNVISCGSFTQVSAGIDVNLGYEPQLLLYKDIGSGGYDWQIIDNMRGFTVSTADKLLQPNTSAAESSNNIVGPTATGFHFDLRAGTYIYIAIRRGPMKVPTSGTSVFIPVSATPSGATTVTTNFPVDLAINAQRDAAVSGNKVFWDRLRGSSTAAGQGLFSNLTNAEVSYAGNGIGLQSNTTIVDNYWNTLNGATTPVIYWNMRRAPSFFDEVCYTGTGSNPNAVSHNLTVIPELIITKRRSTTSNWFTFYNITGSNFQRAFVDLTNAGATWTYSDTAGLGAAPTSTTFTLDTASGVNASASTYVAYLFATCPGVSKVGSYTGTGTTLQVDCGFTGGARFVLIKRTDSTGDWYVWDSARGIVAGNDPYLLLNSTAAEVTSTDYVDTYSAGFEISSTAPAAINANGGTFIFLAIA